MPRARVLHGRNDPQCPVIQQRCAGGRPGPGREAQPVTEDEREVALRVAVAERLTLLVGEGAGHRRHRRNPGVGGARPTARQPTARLLGARKNPTDGGAALLPREVGQQDRGHPLPPREQDGRADVEDDDGAGVHRGHGLDQGVDVGAEAEALPVETFGLLGLGRADDDHGHVRGSGRRHRFLQQVRRGSRRAFEADPQRGDGVRGGSELDDDALTTGE